MKFPLSHRDVILDAVGHVKQGRGIATDYRANFENLTAPCDGIVATYEGAQGGNWLSLTRPNGDALKFAHLDSYLVNKGNVSEGQIVAVTGNSGTATSGPHLHCEVYINGNRVDPELYYSEPVTFKILHINTWKDEVALDYCNKIVREFSSGKIQLEFEFRKLEVTAPPNVNIEQDAAIEAIKKVDIPPDTDGIVVFYEGTLASPWYATYSWPGIAPVITHCQRPQNAPGLLFEVKHQLILAYNKRRGQGPFLENIDNYSGGIAIVEKQIKQLIPYLDAFRDTPHMKLTREETELLYQLLDINDPDESGRKFWVEHELAEFLKVVASDKIKKLEALL